MDYDSRLSFSNIFVSYDEGLAKKSHKFSLRNLNLLTTERVRAYILCSLLIYVFTTIKNKLQYSVQ
jgi:hypothetical protein